MKLIIISYVRLYKRDGPDIVGKGPYATCTDSRSVIFPEGISASNRGAKI